MQTGDDTMDDDEILDLLYSHSESGLKEVSDKYGRLLFSVASEILSRKDYRLSDKMHIEYGIMLFNEDDWDNTE